MREKNVALVPWYSTTFLWGCTLFDRQETSCLPGAAAQPSQHVLCGTPFALQEFLAGRPHRFIQVWREAGLGAGTTRLYSEFAVLFFLRQQHHQTQQQKVPPNARGIAKRRDTQRTVRARSISRLSTEMCASVSSTGKSVVLQRPTSAAQHFRRQTSSSEKPAHCSAHETEGGRGGDGGGGGIEASINGAGCPGTGGWLLSAESDGGGSADIKLALKLELNNLSGELESMDNSSSEAAVTLL
eukprot:scaffold641190_cov18-Prasinocladus_malaysianus.AAC.1